MSPPELSRRAALTGVMAGLALSGCELQARETPPRGAPSGVAPTGTPGSDAATPEDPDAALVASVRADIAAALALVTAGAARRALRAELGDWRRLHRLHLDAVPGEDVGEQQATAVGSVAQVRRRVRREETRLQQTLADAALEAESGPLAALLASMSAGIAQLLAATESGR